MSDQPDLSGKIILVTGATEGIGRVTAERLAGMGARLTILSRNPAKIAQTAAEIRQSTGAEVDTIVADLSVQAQVRAAAQEFLANHDRLDVLINNAGAVFTSRKVSQDGYEMTFALNHLGYFLLTLQLLDKLKASAPARIVNVSSDAHQGASLDFSDLQAEKSYSAFGAYGRSKLANIYFTYELARRLEGSGVTVNCLHPGFVATNFGRSNGGIFQPIFRLAQLFALSQEQGAQTSIYLASSPEVAGVSGKYFDRKKAVASSRISYDRPAAERLWAASLEMTGLPEG
jgi:retinol dehydrogenase 12